jgi:pyruvate formate lyase activating enzyme
MKKPQVANLAQAYTLDQLTAVGELYHREGDALRCVACGHRCLIGEDKRGICKVRFRRQDELLVPWGYVGGLQCDPVEKKPFFHVYPGSDALTFGMLGCDLHCPYCFPGDTTVITGDGPLTLEAAFRSAPRIVQRADGEIAYPEGLQTVAASGTVRPVRAVFKHPYRGPLVHLRPYYLPALRCTPDHRIYATDDPSRPPQPIPAGRLTAKHYLAIPRHHMFSGPQVIDVAAELAHHRVHYKVVWDLSPEARRLIAEATARGQTSRAIGAMLGKSASYIRHVRGKIRRGRAEATRSGGLLLEGSGVRFPNEHRPGIARNIPLHVNLARLLGYYCAEGCVTSAKDRPNSHTLNFSFAPDETHLAEEVCRLLSGCLGLNGAIVRRETTFAVGVTKASAALLFKSLAGGGAAEKRIPKPLFQAPREIVRAFLDAYVEGDGHRYPGGKISITTVSRALAEGVAWLALKLGYLPSIYDMASQESGTILGRSVKRSPHQYSVVWYEGSAIERKAVETATHYLVPLRGVSSADYDGDVYNVEVAEEHNYLAGFFMVKNCQNWEVSQALRDYSAGAPPRLVTPEQLVGVARREGARLVVSSYNEPLITAEWAVAVFRAATAAGLTCAFVSNGNATPEVLDYLRPWVKAYKIDLKGFDDRHYRTLGCPLENVTNGIRMVHERGFWLEVVTLVIPGFNDSEAELRAAARFLASVSRDIPWHVTGFHSDYRMTDTPDTEARALVRAAAIGREEGLRFVYAGNRPGQVGGCENTYCPGCGRTLIERFGFLVRSYAITADGRCPGCQAVIPGVWPGSAAEVRTGDLSMYRDRLPRPLPLR